MGGITAANGPGAAIVIALRLQAVGARASACLTVLLALWGAWVPSAALAQGGSVRGSVTRSDTDAGIAGADVMVRGAGLSTKTDSAGNFTLRGLTAGPVDIAFRAIGFSPASVQLQAAPDETRTVEVRLTPSITTLDVISTTATGDARSIGDVPAAISLADTAAIRQGRTIGLNERLKFMPGVQTASRFGTDDVNIGIRGSASRTRQAIRGVGVLLDGVPLSEPDGVARTDLVEMMGVKRIEVVRGPVSALYGGSSGGVVNIISRTGLDSPGITALTEFGAYGLQKYAGSIGTSLGGGKGSAIGFGSYTTFDGYRDHSNGEIGRGQLQVGYQLARGTALSVDGEASQVEQFLPGQLTVAEFNANPDAAATIALKLNLHRNETRFRVGGHLEQDLNSSGSVELLTYFYYSGRTFDFTYPVGGPNGGILNVNFHRSQIGAKVSAASIGGGPVGLIAGVAYDNVFGTDARWHTSDGSKDAQFDDGYASVPNLGIFGQMEWAVSKAVTLTVGLRYDDVSYRFESYFPSDSLLPRQERSYSQLSPRTTLAWKTSSNDMFYASIARGFEVPAIGEISYSPGTPLLDLNPKSLWNFEVGARGLLGPRLQYDAAIFYADVDGEFVPADRNGVYVVQNASKSRNIGVELALSAVVTRWLDVSATYTFSDFRLQDFTALVNDSVNQLVPVDQSGNLLPAVPQNRITAELRVLPIRGLSLGLQCEWQSLMYVETGNEKAGITYAYNRSPRATPVPFSAVPGRTLFQLNAQYQIGGMQLFAAVDNLFGITYVGNVAANAGNGAYYEAGPGRWFSMGVRVGLWPNGFHAAAN